MRNIFLALCILLFATTHAQTGIKPFRFAFISDTHIGSPNGSAEEDLRRTVRDINSRTDVQFVVLTGDITELGTNEELKLAKQILDSLDVPWYIMPGNHDTGWSESGGVMYTTVFGYDKFSFEHQGIRFLGCPSGPYVRMSDGHVPRDAVNWLDAELATLKPGQPVIFLNHYPIDNGLDNWYEITDRLRKHNTLAILCGHGHSNKTLNFEDIPGVMGRSNLRAKAAIGGYNLVDMRADSMFFTEKTPGTDSMRMWTRVKLGRSGNTNDKTYPRPDYKMNDSFPQVKEKWKIASLANIISTPAVSDDDVIVGNQLGMMTCFSLKDGKTKWTFNTGSAIYSTPAISKGKVVFGSANGTIYCLDTKTGQSKWEVTTAAAVLGCPLIVGDTVFIGGSDHRYRALHLSNGNEIWKFDGLRGPVVSTPLLYQGQLIFGAWDRNLYSVNSSSGKLNWSWNNGSTVRNYSPASCIPVAKDGIVYVIAPDRFISAISIDSGKTVWRSRDGGVRESIGISADGKWVYGKSMQDTIVAYATGTEAKTAWKMHCGFGYEHVPSMLIEKEGLVFFGTKNGVVYCIDPKTQKLVWKHKIDNSMVNTVRVIDSKTLVVTTMDGKIARLHVE